MTRKSNVKIALRQIANSLLLNAGKINEPGFFNGKIGIALFFYHYIQIDNNRVYSGFADELLDDAAGSLNEKMSVNFADGMTGIAWTINYLIENKFIEADCNVLEDIDIVLKNNYPDISADLNSEYPLFSKGIYFIERNYHFDYWVNVLDEIKNVLTQSSRIFPLNYLISIMYVFSQINIKFSADLLPDLYEQMIRSIKNKNYMLPDAWILKNMVEQFFSKQDFTFGMEWNLLLNMLDYENVNGIFNWKIYGLVYNKLKIDNRVVVNIFDSININKQVETMIKDVYRNLNLYNGLAGVGLTLIDYLNCI